MTYISNITRPQGDPKVLRTGPSSLGASDRLARGLGWFSFGLGLVQLFAPRRVTHALGMEGQEGLVRAYGAREIGAGFLTLSLEKEAGLWSRLAGDGLDMVTLLLAAARPRNEKRGNVMLALSVVAAVTMLDLLAAEGVHTRHTRPEGSGGDRSLYRNRSGFPHGLAKARGVASAKESRGKQRMFPNVGTISGGEQAVG